MVYQLLVNAFIVALFFHPYYLVKSANIHSIKINIDYYIVMAFFSYYFFLRNLSQKIDRLIDNSRREK